MEQSSKLDEGYKLCEEVEEMKEKKIVNLQRKLRKKRVNENVLCFLLGISWVVTVVICFITIMKCNGVRDGM